jgi:hypothetical protein
MQLSDGESRPRDIRERMRTIEDELFALSEITRELDVENRSRTGFLRGKRTRLASQMLLKELRPVGPYLPAVCKCGVAAELTPVSTAE